MAIIRMKYRDKLPALLSQLEPGDALEVPYKLRTFGGVREAARRMSRAGEMRFKVTGSASPTHATVTRLS